jgi:hypothetical protein
MLDNIRLPGEHGRSVSHTNLKTVRRDFRFRQACANAGFEFRIRNRGGEHCECADDENENVSHTIQWSKAAETLLKCEAAI